MGYPVELDQRVKPAEAAPVQMNNSIEDVGIDPARTGREGVAEGAEQVRVAELPAGSNIGSKIGRTVPLENILRANRGFPVQAGREDELVRHVLNQCVLGKPADVEPAFARPVEVSPGITA